MGATRSLVHSIVLEYSLALGDLDLVKKVPSIFDGHPGLANTSDFITDCPQVKVNRVATRIQKVSDIFAINLKS
jgi:hypothetical protein